MMRWWPTRLERWIAARYLRGQRGTRSASLQTVVAIGGIATGVMALIVVLGVMNGLRDDLRDRILVASPHLRVLTYGDALVMDDWEEALRRVRTVPGVAAAAPEVISQTMVINAAGYPEAAKVAGLEPGVGTGDVTGIDSSIVSGHFPSAVAIPDSLDGGILLGNRLAARLNVYVGDVVRLLSPRSVRASRVTGSMTPVYWFGQVTGTFETGMFIYDNEFVVMSRETAQDFAGLGDAVSTLGVRVTDPWQAPAVGAAIGTLLGAPYRVETWQVQNEALFKALRIEKLGMGLVIFFIMLVAAFNIVGTLTMMVTFKTREIGILQAMGLDAGAIGRIFLAQGAIVGVVGTVIGTVLGIVVGLVIDEGRLIRLDPSIYFIDRLPIRTDPLEVLLVMAVGMLLALVATIHPVRRAAALTPVEAIRAE